MQIMQEFQVKTAKLLKGIKEHYFPLNAEEDTAKGKVLRKAGADVKLGRWRQLEIQKIVDQAMTEVRHKKGEKSK